MIVKKRAYDKKIYANLTEQQLINKEKDRKNIIMRLLKINNNK